jgi:hypothetical protein
VQGNLFNEIIVENFPNLEKDVDFQAQEIFRIANSPDQKNITLNNIIVKMPRLENKERLLKAAREKCQLTYK